MNRNNERPAGRLGVALAVIVFLATGFGLRVYRVGQPDLWGDEILYLNMCHPGLSLSDVVEVHLKSYKYIHHLPAAALLTNIGTRLQGIDGKDDLAPGNSRLPSVVAGILAVGLLALWVYRLEKNGITALLALVFGAFSYIHIWYSREAYHYSGQMFYGAAFLVCMNGILSKPRNAGVRGLWAAGFLSAALGLALSHATSLALLAVAGCYVLATALLKDRRSIRHYAAFLAIACVIGGMFIFTGFGRESLGGNKRPWSMFMPETCDLLELLVFGPGTIRLLLGLAALGIGAYFAVRKRDGGKTALLASVAALYMLIQIGGRHDAYRPRYFLLVWLLLVWVVSAGLGGLIGKAPPRWRLPLVWGIGALLLVNIAPGLAGLYRINGKRDMHRTLCRLMEENLEPGTVCVWDEGHALRFIPGFHIADKPMLYGALPYSSNEPYEDGHAVASLKMLRTAFPLSAHIEWGERSMLFDRREKAVCRDVFKRIFPGYAEARDQAREDLVKSGWYPDGLPRRDPDYEEKLRKGIEHAVLRLYYVPPEYVEGAVYPVFDPGTWRVVFDGSGRPFVLGGPGGRIRFAVRAGGKTAADGEIDLTILALAPGKLSVVSAGKAVTGAVFGKAGETRRIEFPVETVAGGELSVRYEPASWMGRNPDGALFAVVGVGLRDDTAFDGQEHERRN